MYSMYMPCALGDSKVADIGAQETSSVVVETIAKVSKEGGGCRGPILPQFKSDASKVTSKGMGLKKAYISKQNQFTVSANTAGKYLKKKTLKESIVKSSLLCLRY